MVLSLNICVGNGQYMKHNFLKESSNKSQILCEEVNKI